MNDLISRDEAIKALDDKFTVTGDKNAVTVREYIRGVYNRLCDLPSAQPERKKGHWIDEETNYSCSECHRGCWVNSDYCPWCGARMVRGEEE